MSDILIVDDSAYTRDRLRDALDPLDATIREARHRDEVRAAITEVQPDCIILDLLLAGPGGLDILQDIRDHGLETPVIIVSAFIDTEVRNEAEGLGVHAFIQKPFDAETVRDAVRDALSDDQ